MLFFPIIFAQKPVAELQGVFPHVFVTPPASSPHSKSALCVPTGPLRRQLVQIAGNYIWGQVGTLRSAALFGV